MHAAPDATVPTDLRDFGPGREFQRRCIEARGRRTRRELKRGLDLVVAKEVLGLPCKQLWKFARGRDDPIEKAGWREEDNFMSMSFLRTLYAYACRQSV